MPVVELLRWKPTPDGWFGVLRTPSGKYYWTVELPWRGNKHDVSCIPARRYRCGFTWSPHFARKTYQVLAVPGRSGIRLHRCNFASELLGCIGIGRKVAKFPNGVLGVTNSRTSMDAFVREMGEQPFELRIYQWAA